MLVGKRCLGWWLEIMTIDDNDANDSNGTF